MVRSEQWLGMADRDPDNAELKAKADEVVAQLLEMGERSAAKRA